MGAMRTAGDREAGRTQGGVWAAARGLSGACPGPPAPASSWKEMRKALVLAPASVHPMGPWLGLEPRLPGFGPCAQASSWGGAQGQALGYMWGCVGGSSPWVTAAAFGCSAFPPRSPEGLEQRAQIHRLTPSKWALASLCPAYREGTSRCFPSSTSQAQVPRAGLPQGPTTWPWVQLPDLCRSCLHSTLPPFKAYPSSVPFKMGL